MGHIKTNKTLHLTEILTHLQSFNNYIHSTEDKPSQTSSFFRNNWFLGLNSIIYLQHLPRTTLFKLICRVYAVNRFSKHRRGTTRACMEFTDWLLANQISWDPVCTSWSLIMDRNESLLRNRTREEIGSDTPSVNEFYPSTPVLYEQSSLARET